MEKKFWEVSYVLIALVLHLTEGHHCSPTGYSKPGLIEDCTKSYFHGSVCSYTCSGGYLLDGLTSIECIGPYYSAYWDGKPPGCNPIECTPFPNFDDEFGTRSCDNENKYNSICTTTCSAGYQANGDTAVTCQQDKKWDSVLPTACEPLCEDLTFAGEITCTAGPPVPHPHACTFKCPEGEEIVSGERIIICQEDGQWSASVPTCEARMCQSLTFPGGSVVCEPNNYDYETTCSFECPVGYKPDVPGLTMTCELDKEWSGSMPSSCDPVDCGPYEEVEGGSASCDDGTTYEKVCSVVCDVGYKPKQSTSECMFDGEWSQPPLECSKIKCGALDFSNQPGTIYCDPPDLGYDSTCSFTCDDGYDLTGKAVLKCQESEEWDGIVPTCKDVFCSSLSFDDGTVKCTEKNEYSSTCMFTCSFPLTLYGAEEITCLASGEWSNPVPECKMFDPKCEDALDPLACADNCNNNLDCDESEVCCQSSCGLTCKKIKVSSKKPLLNLDKKTLLGLLLATSMKRPGPVCPRCGRNFNACYYSTCPRYLNAFCGTGCNGCTAHYYNPYNKKESIHCGCPPHTPPNPNCAGYMCNGVGCANFPQAQCRVYGCGPTCYLQFFDRFGRRVQCREEATCQPGINAVGLCSRGCLVASCPKYPTAHCRVRCPGCPPEFYDQKTNRPIVDCNQYNG
ncbi:P-selectin-like isoform X2 [Styela clava]